MSSRAVPEGVPSPLARRTTTPRSPRARVRSIVAVAVGLRVPIERVRSPRPDGA